MLPKVCLHNDFGPWNVYRQGDRITVIDWELGGNGTADRTGPALCDLVYFVTYWTLRTRRLWTEAATRRGFRELFLDPSKGGRASRAAHATIREYLARSGIDPRFLPPLLVYTWIERTLDQLARARAGPHAVLPASVEQYAQFVNLLAEHGERLFNDPLL
jgi:aminoglycoside phosphotransferase (APT) family kinase protein